MPARGQEIKWSACSMPPWPAMMTGHFLDWHHCQKTKYPIPVTPMNQLIKPDTWAKNLNTQLTKNRPTTVPPLPMKPAAPCHPETACMVQCMATAMVPWTVEPMTSLLMPHGALHMNPQALILMAQHPIVAKQKRRSIATRLSDQNFKLPKKTSTSLPSSTIGF